MRAHLHTAVQVLGVLLMLVGAWLVAELPGVLVVVGLLVAGGSLLVEVMSRPNEDRSSLRKPPKSAVYGEATPDRPRVVGPDAVAERSQDVPPGLWRLRKPESESGPV
jgi:hypothetical protein